MRSRSASRLAGDQRLRHGERGALAQARQRLLLDRRVDLVLQLEPEVRLDFLAQVVDGGARDAERLGELAVERRDFGCFDTMDRQREPRALPATSRPW